MHGKTMGCMERMRPKVGGAPSPPPGWTAPPLVMGIANSETVFIERSDLCDEGFCH